jgi:N-acetylglucosamine-6-phosphate deacetylase
MNGDTNIPATGAELWIGAPRIFDGEQVLADRVLHLLNGRVAGIVRRKDLPPAAQVQELSGCLSTGFFDIQVNGGASVLFNSTPTTAGIGAIAAAHRRFGTTALLPTVITDAPKVMDAACQAVIEMQGQSGVKGIHIEGPHISLPRRGTHETKFIRPLGNETLGNLRNLRDAGVKVLITVAPEAVHPGQIAAMVEMGVVVSIGHSDADAAQTLAALNEGATCFTHLFNAMSPMLNRAPGVTGTAINSPAYCSLICDGIHVDDGMVGLAVRARPVGDRMILISDAMPTVGGDDSFVLYGRTVGLVDGRLVNSEGSLAGAHTTMADTLARMVNVVGVDLQAALRMAITNPARLMGLSQDFALIGAPLADLVMLDDNLSCTALIDALPCDTGTVAATAG